MVESVYIAIGDDGHVTIFWGDGTENFKEIVARGPRPSSTQQMITIVEDLKAWAEEQGFTVVVPQRDMSFTDIDLILTDEDKLRLSPEDIDEFLDDLSSFEK